MEAVLDLDKQYYSIQRAQEEMQTNAEITSLYFRSADEARSYYAELPYSVKEQMANVYQLAFAGPPWFECCRCSGCGRFSGSNDSVVCAGCGGEMSEAYPSDYLVNEYFPAMLSKFVPGVLVFVSYNEQLAGWSCGGLTDLRSLVEAKYQGNTQILNSIVDQAEIGQGTNVFYDNETCVRPELQANGYGGLLGQMRLLGAVRLGASTIIGRSVNIPWLISKSRMLADAGYRFCAFVPDGDLYEINGNRRVVYVAQNSAQ